MEAKCVDHLGVQGGGHLLHLAGYDGQHCSQVHPQGIADLKEDGCIGDAELEDGGRKLVSSSVAIFLFIMLPSPVRVRLFFVKIVISLFSRLKAQ